MVSNETSGGLSLEKPVELTEAQVAQLKITELLANNERIQRQKRMVMQQTDQLQSMRINIRTAIVRLPRGTLCDQFPRKGDAS